MPAQTVAATYRFENVRVDTRAHRVLKGGVEVALEPKAYAVLVALLAEPGVALERDRLLDAVWGHRHVTPAVLNRIIALLRKALEDDAEHPRLIRTVHGVGYSFIGILLSDEPAAAANSPGAPAAAPTLPSPSIAVPDSGPALRAPALSPRARTAIALGVLLAVVLGLSSIYLLRNESGLSATLEPAPAPAAVRPSSSDLDAGATVPGVDAVTLALLPIEPTSEPLILLARGFTETLADAFERMPELRLIGLDSAAVAQQRATDPARAAELLGARFVLHGRLTEQGERVRLALFLVDRRDLAERWSREFEFAPEELGQALGPTLDGVGNVLLARASNTAVDPVLQATALARRLYMRSRSVRMSSRAERDTARTLLENTVAAEPSFALGWTGLAQLHRASYFAGDASLDEAATRARAAVERALAIDPDFIEALVTSAAISTMQWRAAEALGVSRRALELRPNHVEALGVRANVISYLGRPNEGLILRQRAAALDPLAGFPLLSMVNDYAMLGRYAEAEAQIERFKQRVPISAYSNTLECRLALWFGEPAKALERLERFDLQQGDANAAVYIAATRAVARSYLAMHDETQRDLDAVPTRLPEAPVYLDAQLSTRWARRNYAETLLWIQSAGRHLAQEPWQSVARAHARALAGDAAGALVDYATALDPTLNRELIGNSWFSQRFGMHQLGNWIALRKAGGLDYEEELDDLAGRVDAALAGGTGVPAIHYQRAMLAALRDDVAEADALLHQARARGWFDPLALEVDLVWRPFRDSDWMQEQRVADAAKVASERAKLGVTD
jgi:DNA-binding winged helix-turn-helix (wHTH) protein/TolB-like protein